MSKPRIVVIKERHQCLFSHKISKSPIERLRPELVAENPRWYESQIGEDATFLMRALFKVPGVDELCFYTHSASIYLKKDADEEAVWKKILTVLTKHILTIMRKRLDAEVEVVILRPEEFNPHYFHPEDSGHPSFPMPQ